MNDLSKNASSSPVRRKKSGSCKVQGSFVDPSEIGIDDDYSSDHGDNDKGSNGGGFDPKEIGIDNRGHSYDHGEGYHGWYDSGCGNPSDAG